MGFTIGMPSLKLNNVGGVSKHRGDFRKVADEALQERRGLDADINPELADKNIYIGFTTAEELIAHSAQHIKEINEWRAANGERPCDRRKLKADTVVMCSTIIKPPAEMMLQMPKEMQEQFLRDALDIFKDFVGAENIKSAALHFDERVPHMHIFWEPMTDKHRICAKDMHNLKFFRQLNTEMPQMLRDKGWTMVDDCDAYDAEKVAEMSDEEKEKYEKERIEKRKNQGKNSRKFKYEIEKEIAEAEKKCDEVKEDVQRLETQKSDLQKDVQQLEEQKAELQEQTAEEQEKLEQAKRETVMAIEKPPRPAEIALIAKPEMPKDPRTVSYWTKEEYHDYQRVQLPAWKKECKAIDRQNAEIEKQNALIRQQQAEWDATYNLTQMVQQVQEQQEQTAARQALIAQQQSQTARQQQEQAAALIAAQKSIPQKIAEGVREQLSRSERLAQLMQTTASWKQRYEQMFNKPYTDTPQERTDLDADKSHKTKQDIHRWTR